MNIVHGEVGRSGPIHDGPKRREVFMGLVQ